MHAEKCPVCCGDKEKSKNCQGCGGKGWVQVEDSIPTYVPYLIYPSPYYPPINIYYSS